MTVYILLPLYGEPEAQWNKAEVTAVHETGVDLLLENGAMIRDWQSAVCNENNEEIPLDLIRRDLLLNDPAALRKRIAALEVMMTQA